MLQLNVNETGHRNVGRVDHVVYRYATREARDAARDDFVAKFGFGNWTDMGPIPEAGIHVLIDWDAGIELIAPIDDAASDQTEPPALMAVVFGVADLDVAVARAQAEGVRTVPITLSQDMKDLTAQRFAIGREALIPPADIGGVPIVLGEFKPLPGRETLRVDNRGRAFPDSVDHLVFAFADMDLLEAAIKSFTAILGVEKWHDLGVLEPGLLRVVIAPDAGLEFICPSAPGGFLDAHIARHGAVSFFAQVIGVADFDTTAERMRALGGKVHERLVHPALLDHADAVRHASAGRVGGFTTTLSEVIAQDRIGEVA